MENTVCRNQNLKLIIFKYAVGKPCQDLKFSRRSLKRFPPVLTFSVDDKSSRSKDTTWPYKHVCTSCSPSPVTQTHRLVKQYPGQIRYRILCWKDAWLKRLCCRGTNLTDFSWHLNLGLDPAEPSFTFILTALYISTSPLNIEPWNVPTQWQGLPCLMLTSWEMELFGHSLTVGKGKSTSKLQIRKQNGLYIPILCRNMLYQNSPNLNVWPLLQVPPPQSPTLTGHCLVPNWWRVWKRTYVHGHIHRRALLWSIGWPLGTNKPVLVMYTTNFKNKITNLWPRRRI